MHQLGLLDLALLRPLVLLVPLRLVRRLRLLHRLHLLQQLQPLPLRLQGALRQLQLSGLIDFLEAYNRTPEAGMTRVMHRVGDSLTIINSWFVRSLQ